MSARDQIRSHLLEHYYVLHEKQVGDSDPLAGLLDSLAVLDVINFLEHRFAIVLNPEDVTEQNFATIAAIAALVERKSGASG
jgi:acyl carrier protein